METSENPTTGATKPQQNIYVSIDEWIIKMKITFSNAALPEIASAMQTVGYTPEKINAMKVKLQTLEDLNQKRTKEYADKLSATSELDLKRNAVDLLYSAHRKLAKILFKSNIQVQAVLQLNDAKPLAYAAWSQQAVGFYAQISSTPNLQAQVATVGINAAIVSEQKQALVDLQLLKDNQLKEDAEAQAATDARDRAFDELHPLYTDYLQYAKVLLADNQALEAIGVKVKAK